MKRISFLLFFSMMFFVVHGHSAESVEIDNAEKKAEAKVMMLDKSDFISMIYNYELHPDEWVYEGGKPCIIDFYADWCGPCRAVAPVLKKLAEEYREEVLIYKVNVDKERELASLFGIRSIPAILFVPVEGKPQMYNGALPKEAFVKQIKEFLLKND